MIAIMKVIGDISRVGIVKLLLFIILVAVIAFVLFLIAGLISQWNGTVGGIITGIVGIYVIFFAARAIGLLYSDV